MIVLSRGGLACRSLRWRVSLVGTGDNSFGLDLGRGAGIDISTSETSETPSSGSKSIGSSRWSPRAFSFPFMLPFIGFSWGTVDLRWGCLGLGGAGASSFSVTTIGSVAPWAFSSGLAWTVERLAAVGLRDAAGFLVVMARNAENELSYKVVFGATDLFVAGMGDATSPIRQMWQQPEYPAKTETRIASVSHGRSSNEIIV